LASYGLLACGCSCSFYGIYTLLDLKGMVTCVDVDGSFIEREKSCLERETGKAGHVLNVILFLVR
jgi:hypothetical protein